MGVDSIKDTQIRRSVLVGVTSNYAGKLINLGVWFFLTPFLLRHLGASAYGLWVLVTSVAAYGGSSQVRGRVPGARRTRPRPATRGDGLMAVYREWFAGVGAQRGSGASLPPTFQYPA